ncbi:MAG: 30S ribosomal protein S1 [Clostridia bacterium]|nr:30S ribosomal protein S1 [Clostridia bacterium]
MNQKYLPEGLLLQTPENKDYTESLQGLEKAMQTGRTLEGIALSCDGALCLTVKLGGGIKGIIPREEATLPFPDRKEKDIAIISRVGKPVCFKVLSLKKDSCGTVIALLSRKAAQEECRRKFLSQLAPGDVIPARVTHTEPFGAFVDIGCGVVSLLSIDCISVSRISHPRERFSSGDYIRVAVKSCDPKTGRIYVTHKELLGSWQENAALFETGQTVTGIIRSIEEYGIFVELTPNLAGLAEYKEGTMVGQRAAVFIKNIIPERMKIKLVLIDCYKEPARPEAPVYFLPEECRHIDRFLYSPAGCEKTVQILFTQTHLARPLPV